MKRWPDTIGFIGLGIMGNPMATHLVKAGYRVIAHDLSAERVEALVRKGAEKAGSVARP